MSNFWKLSDGTTPEQTNNFDAGGGDFEPIPDGTDVLAIIEEAGWRQAKDISEPDSIQLRWSVLKPDAYKNRKVFQKIKAKDPETKVSDKAKRMLMAIDFNAGGKLAKLDHAPEDNDLMLALMNKPMVLKLRIWEMNDKSGNWVAAVSAHKKAATPTATPKPDPRPEPPPADLDDDFQF